MNFKDHQALYQYKSKYYLYSDEKYDYWIVNVLINPTLIIIMGNAFYDYNSFTISIVEKLIKAHSVFSKLKILL